MTQQKAGNTIDDLIKAIEFTNDLEINVNEFIAEFIDSAEKISVDMFIKELELEN